MSQTTPIQIDADDNLLQLLDSDAASNFRTRKAQVMYIVTSFYKEKLKNINGE